MAITITETKFRFPIEVIYNGEIVDFKFKGKGPTGGHRFVGKIGKDRIFKCDYREYTFENRSMSKNDFRGARLEQQTKYELKTKIEAMDLRFFPKILDHGKFKNKWGLICYWLVEEAYEFRENFTLTAQHALDSQYITEKYNLQDVFPFKKRKKYGKHSRSTENFAVRKSDDQLVVFDFAL